MSNQELILTLGKLFIAVAWADGKVTEDELNTVKDLLFHLPEINTQQWGELKVYVDTPVSETERQRLLEELKHLVRTSEDKQIARETLTELLRADGQVTADEKAIANEITAVLDEAQTGIMGIFSRFVNRALSDYANHTPNRERYVDDLLHNQVYYGVKRRLHMEQEDLNIPDEKLRRLSLAGGLMSQVARVHPHISEAEFGAIVDALQEKWHITEMEATLVAEVATAEELPDMDSFALARRFVDTCTKEELLDFLDVLFAVAVADGEASFDEIEEIRTIAKTLKLTHKQFIDAKLKIPREMRRQ